MTWELRFVGQHNTELGSPGRGALSSGLSGRSILAPSNGDCGVTEPSLHTCTSHLPGSPQPEPPPHPRPHFLTRMHTCTPASALWAADTGNHHVTHRGIPRPRCPILHRICPQTTAVRLTLRPAQPPGDPRFLALPLSHSHSQNCAPTVLKVALGRAPLGP